MLFRSSMALDRRAMTSAKCVSATLLLPMMVRRFGIAGLFLAAACSGNDSAAPASASPTAAYVRKESSATAGDSGQLASELLLATDGQPTSLQPAAPVAGGALSAQLVQMALDHVRSELGSGAGPSLEGSDRIRRLAAEPTAPPDGNANQIGRAHV